MNEIWFLCIEKDSIAKLEQRRSPHSDICSAALSSEKNTKIYDCIKRPRAGEVYLPGSPFSIRRADDKANGRLYCRQAFLKPHKFAVNHTDACGTKRFNHTERCGTVLNRLLMDMLSIRNRLYMCKSHRYSFCQFLCNLHEIDASLNQVLAHEFNHGLTKRIALRVRKVCRSRAIRRCSEELGRPWRSLYFAVCPRHGL